MLIHRGKAGVSSVLPTSRSQCASRKLRSVTSAATSAAGSSSSSSSSSSSAVANPGNNATDSSSTALSIVPWAISNGIQFAKMKPAVFGSAQQRGVVATYDISSNECICSVPAKAALRTYPGCSPVLGVAADVWQQLPWYAQLALVLLSELQQERSSKFADYLALLPGHVDVPALWTEEQLQQLRCDYFIEQVQQQRQEWAALAQQLERCLSAAGFTQQQLLWALSITRSRAFAAPYAAAPLSTAPKVLVVAQVIAAAAWLALGPGAAAVVEVVGAAAAAGAWVALQQQLNVQLQHAICPLLDFFNHDGRELSECELDVWSSAFRVVASRHWRQGQQVFISYGQSSSDVLLQLYGFIETGNVHERYLVRSLPGTLVQQGLLATLEQGASLAEVTFTLQGIPASAAAALEQACKQQQQQLASLDASGVAPYVALSAAARAACAEAIQQELQLLGADQQTLSHDQAILQAVEQLPGKQLELAARQGLLHERQADLQHLQQQQLEQQQQQQYEAALIYVEGGDPPASAESDDGSATEFADKQAELSRMIADAAADMQSKQIQVVAMQQLVADWQELVAGKKQLAVQFRLEKQQLLDSILTLLTPV